VDLNRIIIDLKAQRDVLAAAIECLERLAAGRGKKRGRPPAWMRPASGGNRADVGVTGDSQLPRGSRVP
jgi:hypothetical protein